MAKLVLSADSNILHQYFIDEAPLSIGRDRSSTVHVDHPMVSRRHARIITVGEDHIIEDLGGSNGTWVNGSRVGRRILQHRDIIDLGAYQLCYLNSRVASDIELDRTMLIAALPEAAAANDNAEYRADDLPGPAIPVRRPLKVRFPDGRARLLSGTGAGKTVVLDQVVTTFGEAGRQVVVITRRPHGFFLSPVEGSETLRVNARTIDQLPYALQNGDEIDVGGQLIEFSLGTAGKP